LDKLLSRCRAEQLARRLGDALCMSEVTRIVVGHYRSLSSPSPLKGERAGVRGEAVRLISWSTEMSAIVLPASVLHHLNQPLRQILHLMAKRDCPIFPYWIMAQELVVFLQR